MNAERRRRGEETNGQFDAMLEQEEEEGSGTPALGGCAAELRAGGGIRVDIEKNAGRRTAGEAETEKEQEHKG